jgi:hypothetical protein
VKRLEVARERRFEAERMDSDEVVEENRERAVELHHAWVNAKRKDRNKVVKRIEAANRDKANRVEEHAGSVRKYDETVRCPSHLISSASHPFPIASHPHPIPSCR